METFVLAVLPEMCWPLLVLLFLFALVLGPALVCHRDLVKLVCLSESISTGLKRKGKVGCIVVSVLILLLALFEHRLAVVCHPAQCIEVELTWYVLLVC